MIGISSNSTTTTGVFGAADAARAGSASINAVATTRTPARRRIDILTAGAARPGGGPPGSGGAPSRIRPGVAVVLVELVLQVLAEVLVACVEDGNGLQMMVMRIERTSVTIPIQKPACATPRCLGVSPRSTRARPLRE